MVSPFFSNFYDYIYYYNTQQVQRNLGVVTPMEKHRMAFAA